jgi:fatty acid-binding protein DegV
MKTGFVTDSTSDIPTVLAGQYGIEIAPALVNVTTAIGTHVGPHGLGFVAVPVL